MSSVTAENITNENTEISSLDYNMSDPVQTANSGSFSDLSNDITNAGDNLVLDKDYTYNPATDSSYFSGITINKKITINGNNHTINGLNISRIFYVGSGAYLILNNVNIINGYSDSNGGAIYNYNGNVNILNSTFKNCYSTNYGGVIYNSYGYIDIANSEFKDCHADKYAGVVYNYRGLNLNISNSTFDSCYANNYAGVIYNVESTFKCYNSSFINNEAGLFGAAVFNFEGDCNFNNTKFINNSAVYGTIYDWSGRTNITNTEFINNTAVSAAAIYTLDESKCIVINSTFRNNSASDSGGSISTNKRGSTSGSLVDIYNSTFVDNSAGKYGGAILSGFAGINIYNTTFVNNTSNGHGGAIYNHESNILISDSDFLGNYANESGGVIFSNTGTNIILNSNIINNTAKLCGGAINGNSSSIIKNSNFINNSASYGGCIIDGIVDIENCDFINNSAIESGAIESVQLKVINTTFENNNAKGVGVIFVENGDIANSTFINNHALHNIIIYSLKNLDIKNNINLSDNQIFKEKDLMEINVTQDLDDMIFITEDGYIGLCIQLGMLNSTRIFISNNTYFVINTEGNIIFEYLKILVYLNATKQINIELKDLQSYVHRFTNNVTYGNVSEDVINQIIGLYDSGFRVPTYNSTYILENKTQATINFYIGVAAAVQNLFMFKIDQLGNEYNYTVDKITNDWNVTIGDEVEFIITIKNTGDTILNNIRVNENYPGNLIFKSFEGEHWIRENNTFIYQQQLGINKTIVLKIIFEAVKPGNATNIVIVSTNEVGDKNASANVTIIDKNETPVTPENPVIPDNDTNMSDDNIGVDNLSNNMDNNKSELITSSPKTGNPLLLMILCLFALIFPIKRKK